MLTLAATANMAALTESITTAVSGLDFSPLYETLISLIPVLMPISIGILGLKRAISFVFSTIKSF